MSDRADEAVGDDRPDPVGDLRERLTQILRARPPGGRAAFGGQGLWLAPPTGTTRDTPLRAGPRRLEDLLPGEEIAGAHGACWLARWDLDERAIEADAVVRDMARVLRARSIERVERVGGGVRNGERDGGRNAEAGDANAPRGGYLLLDLETTGLAGAPLFLAGLIDVTPESAMPALEQLFARDYSEEAAVVEEIAARLAAGRVLVTFNGKSFDLPFLRDRAACHHIRFSEPIDHLDLLHAARRRFRDILPNCRLVTLEEHLGCGARIGDVPGWEIPARYHDAVRRGDPSGLAGVFLHNARDMVALAKLCVELGGGEL